MDAGETRRSRRPGLLAQIAIALALVGIVPVALAVWQLVGVNREAMYDQVQRTHTVAARTAADALDAYLAGKRALGAALAADPRLLSDPTGRAAQELLRDSLAAWSAGGVAGLVLLDPAGSVALRVRARDRAALVDSLVEPPPVSAPRLAAVDGHAWAAIPVALAGGAGTLVLVADAEPVAVALNPDELGEQARLLLLDAHRNAVWGAPHGAAALGQELSAALTGRLAGAGRYTEPGGARIIAAWAGTDRGRWIVLSMQPGTIAEAAARSMAKRSIVAVAASALLVVAISLAAWRGLVRPLRALLAAQRASTGAGGDRNDAAAGSETDQLRDVLAELERRASERAALDQIFLGRYQVVALVGSGGMGSVYRGWDPRLQRTVALKTIQLATEAPDGEGARKLLEEAVAVAQITHPHVVAVYDAEERGGAAFVAMELVDGVGLDKYLEKRGRLDWREVVPLGAALADGLAAAHARELVHRDIKPGNVLLGHDGTIKIADFGLATFLHRLHHEPGKVFGTPGFLAPEALQGMPIDERCDLYAVGVLLYRAAVGRYPVRGTSFKQIVASTVRDPAPRPEELADLPPEVAEVICGLLEKNPDHRLGPAGEIARRLRAIVHDHQLSWRLDYGEGGATASGALSAAIPTMHLDADLA